MKFGTASTRLRLACLAVLASGVITSATAQEYPSRAVTLLVGFNAGGGTDIVARIAAEHLGQVLNQRFIVENRPGANTTIAIRAVAQAPADGYTLLFSTLDIANNLHGMKEPGYKLEDFVVVGGVTHTPLMLIVNTASSNAKTLKDFAEFGKAHPNQLKFAANGATTVTNLLALRLQKAAGFSATIVPYQGGAQIIPDLLAGRVDAFIGALPSTLLAVKDGPTMMALGVTGDERMDDFPDVPTFAESGYPMIDTKSVTGIWAPVGTPEPVLEKLRGALAEVAKNAEFKERIEKLSASVYVKSPAEFDAEIAELVTRFGAQYQEFGISPQ